MTNKIIDIRPESRSLEIDFTELWQYRDLFYLLVRRDIAVRYKQTLLGGAWAIIQPLSTMLIFTLIFGKLAKMPSDGLPYELFSFSGLILWTFFSHSMSQSAQSLVADERLVTKVYFPRVIIPVAPVIGALADLAISFVLLLVMMSLFGVFPSQRILVAPVFVLLALITSVGCGTLLGSLNVKFRDFRYIIPFFTQFWMFATPVVYPASLIPEKWRFLAGLNPLTGAVEGFRWAVMGVDNDPWLLVFMSSVTSICSLLMGIFYFRKTEQFFADFI